MSKNSDLNIESVKKQLEELIHDFVFSSDLNSVTRSYLILSNLMFKFYERRVLEFSEVKK